MRVALDANVPEILREAGPGVINFINVISDNVNAVPVL
jgi:hypothetical protein